jgi:hypothetical protein
VTEKEVKNIVARMLTELLPMGVQREWIDERKRRMEWLRQDISGLEMHIANRAPTQSGDGPRLALEARIKAQQSELRELMGLGKLP